MFRLLAGLALVVTPAVVAAPIPPDNGWVPYHAAAVGTRWVYSDDQGGSARVATAAETKDGATTVRVEQVRPDGAAQDDEVVEVSARGLRRKAVAGQALDPPARLLVVPAPAGTKWEDKSTFMGRTVISKYASAGVEEVTVPAGRFTAVRVNVAYRDGDTDRTATFWVAPRVGVVKLTADGEVVRELVTFTPPGKK